MAAVMGHNETARGQLHHGLSSLSFPGAALCLFHSPQSGVGLWPPGSGHRR